MIIYKEFLNEIEEYHTIMEVYQASKLDYVADAYLKENDESFSDRKKLEYPYTTLATMLAW